MSCFNAEDANNAENAELPSIEELTRHMQDLTDADKSDADLIELAETAKETLESSVVAVERSEVAGAETAHAHEADTGNTEDEPIDTIQVRACTCTHTSTHLERLQFFTDLKKRPAPHYPEPARGDRQASGAALLPGRDGFRATGGLPVGGGGGHRGAGHRRNGR